MSRVERLESSETKRRPQNDREREARPNPRKAATTPDQAEGDERTIDEALRNQEQQRVT